MKKKPGMTFQEHKELGPVLREARTLLSERGVRIASRYPKDSRVYRLALDAHKAVDELREELRKQVGSEHPNLGEAEEVY